MKADSMASLIDDNITKAILFALRYIMDCEEEMVYRSATTKICNYFIGIWPQ